MDESDPSLLPHDRTGERFRFFANTIYASKSPLYTNLALRMAEDSELLRIAATAEEKDALPNLFFAAVHLLLLNGVRHQLAAFYPSLNTTSRHYDYVYPYFRSFVLEHQEEIREIITTRSVQTNEVGRCAVLVPAFDLVARQTKDLPLSLIEIGSSAGLTLLWDRYHYRYGDDMQCGDPNSIVRIECQLRGEKRPFLPETFPKIASRIGVDLSPIDLNIPENVQWLLALVWPEHQKRAAQLQQSIQFTRENPTKILTGNALDLLPSLISYLPRDNPVCIYHSFTLTFAKEEPRGQLLSLVTKASERRDLFLVWMEWRANSETPLLGLVTFKNGARTEKILARCGSHGEWMEWVNH